MAEEAEAGPEAEVVPLVVAAVEHREDGVDLVIEAEGEEEQDGHSAQEAEVLREVVEDSAEGAASAVGVEGDTRSLQLIWLAAKAMHVYLA